MSAIRSFRRRLQRTAGQMTRPRGYTVGPKGEKIPKLRRLRSWALSHDGVELVLDCQTLRGGGR